MEPVVSPLARKLKLEPGTKAAVAGAPGGYLDRLAPPPDATISDTLDDELYDWIPFFVRTSADLAAIVGPLTDSLSPTGHIWICTRRASPSSRRT